MLKLFYTPGACSMVPHIALEEAGAQYEKVLIDFRAGDQLRPEFLKVNPKARVPVLLTDRGVLTEIPAILGYIAFTYPAARLAEIHDHFAFADMQAFHMFIATTIHITFRQISRPDFYADGAAAADALRAKGCRRDRTNTSRSSRLSSPTAGPGCTASGTRRRIPISLCLPDTCGAVIEATQRAFPRLCRTGSVSDLAPRSSACCKTRVWRIHGASGYSGTPNQRQRRRLYHSAQERHDRCARLEAEFWDLAEKLLHGNRQFTPRQRRSDAAMRTMAESHLARVAIQLNLVGVRKYRRIAIGERGRHGDLVA